MIIHLSALPGTSRPPALRALYGQLETLYELTDGPYHLNEVDGRLEWPDRGMYLFFSPNTDMAYDPVSEWDLVRIGIMGDSAGTNSSRTLWERLREHRGTLSGKYAGGGSARSSVFRRHVGRCLIERDGLDEKYPNWGVPHSSLPDSISQAELRAQEHPLEQRVSKYIASLPFLVVDIPGDSGPDSSRAHLERNLIALVSHARRTNPDLMRGEWLGSHSPKAEIAKTGLWNIQHTSGLYTESVVEDLRPYIESTDSIGVEPEEME